MQIIACHAIGNITFKSDVGTYKLPSADQPKPHGVTCITGGTIKTTFTPAFDDQVVGLLHAAGAGEALGEHPAAPR